MSKLTRGLAAAVATVLLVPVAASAADSFRQSDQLADVQVTGSAPAGFDSRRSSYDIREIALSRTGDTITATFEMGGLWPGNPAAYNGFELRVQASDNASINDTTWVFRRESRDPLGTVNTIRTDHTSTTIEREFCPGAGYAIDTTTLTLRVPASCIDHTGPVYAAWRTFEAFDSEERSSANDFAPNVDMAGPLEMDTVGSDTDPKPRPTPEARVYSDTCDGEQDHTFADATGTTHDYSIRCISGYGITQGKGDGSYDPGGTLTHGQTATFLRATLAAGNEPVADATSDLCKGQAGVHEDSIEALAQAGIISASACSQASSPISRATMAVWTSGALDHAAVAPVSDSTDWYSDDDGRSEEAHINRITSYGIVTGKGGGLYGPSETLTRGQMATFLARTLDTVLDGG